MPEGVAEVAESDVREDIADLQEAVVELAEAVDMLADDDPVVDVHENVDDALDALFDAE